MTPEIMVLLLFSLLVITILVTGYPIGFALCGVSLICGLLGWGPQVINLFAQRAYGMMITYTYIAIPLFIFMGCMLEKSGVAEVAFDAMYRFFGPLRGGLGVATIVICVMFAASSGIVGAAVTAMGLTALPAMLKHGYDKSLATGLVSAGGTLGILIPPSVMLILYAPMAGVSVVDMFAGAIMPGLLLGVLFIIYTLIKCWLNPKAGPAIPKEKRIPFTFIEGVAMFSKSILPFFFLIISVLGVILFGVCAPTEAAAFGALGSIILTAAYKRLTWKGLKATLLETFQINAMIFMITLGATMFTAVFFGVKGEQVVLNLLLSTGIGKWGTLAFTLIVVVILGMFVDWLGILFILVPVCVPVFEALGFNPLWSSVLVCVALQTSFITPPFAYALFYIKGVAPPEVTMPDIYKGVLPFLAMQIVAILACILFPQVITWLPAIMH
jgi:tripartite ATP-independent transporter DctM subunit